MNLLSDGRSSQFKDSPFNFNGYTGIPGPGPPTIWTDLVLNFAVILRSKSDKTVGGSNSPGIPVYSPVHNLWMTPRTIMYWSLNPWQPVRPIRRQDWNGFQVHHLKMIHLFAGVGTLWLDRPQSEKIGNTREWFKGQIMRRTHSEKTFQTFYFKDFFKKYTKSLKEIYNLETEEP